ncbi:energy-coupling factor transporter ATPase [Brochothrix thermosphacta]|uniref:energy-coupling factor ABC transporter ATP-binding protein n=1 Tax=Brochothrix thermosphacta TaxID=2756 RepID=UPI00083FB53D|nr:energy-coupling factor ABC transporter ATP-binding protein [Brochothrix thermosphacta]ODJ49406.1 energy-coupling factor transporter ATPase [Brochothrix thermosphacta]
MPITFEKVGYTYQVGGPFEKTALKDISFSVEDGTYTAIVGHTGSGKSTLLQHLNVILQPTAGKVIFDSREIIAGQKYKNLKEIRQKIGVVFQFPEAQLFEETVVKDIMFGPMNFGVSKEDAKKRAERLLPIVGLPESIKESSPFELSGGQMRRVAIAGVLAMEPDILVLDEPTAGLDPRGRREMMDLFNRLHKEQNITIILVTHNMDDVAEFADKMIVLQAGKVSAVGEPRALFAEDERMHGLAIGQPSALVVQRQIEAQTAEKWPVTCLTRAELVAYLTTDWRGGQNDE